MENAQPSDAAMRSHEYPFHPFPYLLQRAVQLQQSKHSCGATLIRFFLLLFRSFYHPTIFSFLAPLAQHRFPLVTRICFVLGHINNFFLTFFLLEQVTVRCLQLYQELGSFMDRRITLFDLLPKLLILDFFHLFCVFFLSLLGFVGESSLPKRLLNLSAHFLAHLLLHQLSPGAHPRGIRPNLVEHE